MHFDASKLAVYGYGTTSDPGKIGFASGMLYHAQVQNIGLGEARPVHCCPALKTGHALWTYSLNMKQI